MARKSRKKNVVPIDQNQVDDQVSKVEAGKVNIVQVVELDPSKKYLIVVNDEIKRHIANNVINGIDKTHFEGRSPQFVSKILEETVDNAIQRAMKRMMMVLNDFMLNPDLPFYLVPLEGNDYLHIKAIDNDDQEQRIHVEVLGDPYGEEDES